MQKWITKMNVLLNAASAIDKSLFRSYHTSTCYLDIQNTREGFSFKKRGKTLHYSPNLYEFEFEPEIMVNEVINEVVIRTTDSCNCFATMLHVSLLHVLPTCNLSRKNSFVASKCNRILRYLN